MSAVAVALACVQGAGAFRAFFGLQGQRRTLAVVCGVWLVSFLPLLAVWDPANIELWYAACMPLAVLLAIPLTTVRARRLWVGVGLLLVSGVFAVNLVGSQLPQRAEARDYWRARASWYVAHVDRDDLIVSYDYIWSNYLRYLTRANVIDAQQVAKEHGTAATVRIVNASIARSNADRIYVSGYIEKPPAQECLADQATCTINAALWRSLRARVRLVGHSEFESVWQLVEPGE